MFSDPRLFPYSRDRLSKLCNYPSSFDESIAEAVARFAYYQGANADALLVTGDLATTGMREDIDVAAKYMSTSAFKYMGNQDFPTIGAACKNLFFIPGNHDRYLDTSGNPGSREFERTFHNIWGKQHPDVTHRIIIKKDQALGMIGVDFSLKSNMDAEAAFLHYGQGRVYQERLDELTGRTEVLRERFPGIFIVWLIHFPPTSQCSFKLRLINHHWVERAANSCDVRLILSGHTHESDVSRIGDCTIVCAGSACSVEHVDGNWVHVVEIDCEQNELIAVKRRNYKWSDDDSDFVEITGPV